MANSLPCAATKFQFFLVAYHIFLPLRGATLSSSQVRSPRISSPKSRKFLRCARHFTGDACFIVFFRFFSAAAAPGLMPRKLIFCCAMYKFSSSSHFLLVSVCSEGL
ncbi:hypothetical protein C8J57DRAFT_231606 [Mycena rebaudengoi]|nr:hypothetical protein C8J57DRAFT_231606 [Mycena rebaudengoi]